MKPGDTVTIYEDKDKSKVEGQATLVRKLGGEAESKEERWLVHFADDSPRLRVWRWIPKEE